MALLPNPAIGHYEPPVFDGYEVVRRLGTGAASTIFSVRDQNTGELCALKHVIRQDGQDKRMIEQVENEFEVARKVDHPYVRKVHEIKKIKRRLQVREIIMLMEYCPGVSLEQSPSHSLLDLLLIFRMVADGVNGMHEAGQIHCDMKPNNVILAENGSIRVIDLGQSCPVGTIKPRIQGTPDYISPEQVKRKPVTRQTDVFNLGATIYWALTGKHIPTQIPKKMDKIEVLSESRLMPPPAPHELKPIIPVGVSNLIMECVKKNPKERPANMNELISRLDLLIHMIAGGKTSNENSRV